MCQIVAPPTPSLAGPLQAPGGWLLVVGVLVLWAVVVVRYFRHSARPLALRVGRKVALALLVCGLLIQVTGMVLLVLVSVPANDALGTWGTAQFHALQSHQCSASVINAFFASWQHAQNGISSLENLGFAALVGGYLLLFVGFAWPAGRTHTPPARQ